MPPDETDPRMSATMTTSPTLIPWSETEARLLRDPAVRAVHDEHILAEAVALALVSHRAAHGLSQTALGRLLGMRQPQVCRLEAGDHTPDFATLQRICDALDLEIAIEIGPRTDASRAIPARLAGHAVTDASTQAVVAIRPARAARS